MTADPTSATGAERGGALTEAEYGRLQEASRKDRSGGAYRLLGEFVRIVAEREAAARADERAKVLREVAVSVARKVQARPMNGDGSNYALAQIIEALDRLAGDHGPSSAAAAERTAIEQRSEESRLRMEAENAARIARAGGAQ